MPQTHMTFLIGSLALAGIFPLAGFWSKDEILVAAGHEGYKLFLVVGLVGAVMTAAYMTRCMYLTFYGEYRGAYEPHAIPHIDEAEHDPTETHAAVVHEAHTEAPHESNNLIVGPLWVLSGFALVAGLLNFPHWLRFEHWFAPRSPAFEEGILHEVAFNPILAAISVVGALAGAAFVAAYYTGQLPALRDLSLRNGAAHAGKRILVNKYYLDDLYEDIVVAGVKGPVANAVYWVNQHVIDNVLNYAGRGARGLGRITYDYVDQKGVDGIVNGIGAVTGESGGAVRRIQTGRLQFYALMLVAATGLFALVLWLFT